MVRSIILERLKTMYGPELSMLAEAERDRLSWRWQLWSALRAGTSCAIPTACPWRPHKQCGGPRLTGCCRQMISFWAGMDRTSGFLPG